MGDKTENMQSGIHKSIFHSNTASCILFVLLHKKKQKCALNISIIPVVVVHANKDGLVTIHGQMNLQSLGCCCLP